MQALILLLSRSHLGTRYRLAGLALHLFKETKGNRYFYENDIIVNRTHDVKCKIVYFLGQLYLKNSILLSE